MKKILTEFTGVLVKKDDNMQENEAEILHDIAKTAIEQLLNEKEDLFNDRFKNGLIRGLIQESSEKNIRPGLLAAFLNYERSSKDMIEPFMANISFSNIFALSIKANASVYMSSSCFFFCSYAFNAACFCSIGVIPVVLIPSPCC